MRLIDYYVQHLIRHSATAVELYSDQPVRFRFPTGDRQSSKPIVHAQITQLVEEAASPQALSALRSGGTTRFRHTADGGVEVDVAVQASAPGQWRVIIRQADMAAPPAPPAPPRPATEAADTGTEAAVGKMRASQPPPARVQTPQVSLGAGEPALNRYLRMMTRIGGSDLHISSGVPPMVRVHGEMQIIEDRPPFEAAELAKMIDEILPERNRDELKATWDTDFAHEIEDVARFRVNVFMDRKGMGAVMRLIPFEILSADQLGIPPRVLDLCWLTKGLVVVTGPTGSGKSTTLAALIDFINKNRSDHIITIEDPIEFVHENQRCLVNQREVGTHTKSFKGALRAALREDPDIVLVGEMRDLETIAIAIETAETGHLVFGTLHTTSAVSTVDRIIDQFPADRQAQIRVMLSESLRGVVAQVLCKKQAGGRVAALEIMMSTPAVANLIREGKTYQLTSVLQTGGRLGMQTMNDHLLRLVNEGVIAPEEAYMKSNDKEQVKQRIKQLGIQLKLDVAD